MTVHSAKGLEFPHVFILRVSKNDFPSGVRKVVFEFPPELMKEEQPKVDFQMQEERRLFYVALTRARAATDAFDDREQAQEAVTVSRRFSGECEDQNTGHASADAEGAGAAGAGGRGTRSRFERPRATLSAGQRTIQSVFARGAVGQGVSSAATGAAATERFGD